MCYDKGVLGCLGVSYGVLGCLVVSWGFQPDPNVTAVCARRKFAISKQNFSLC